MVSKHRLKFEILHDFANQFAQELDLVHGFPDELKEVYLGFGADLALVNGEPSWTLPIPARIATSSDHKIISIQFDADYKQRPEPEEVLADF